MLGGVVNFPASGQLSGEPPAWIAIQQPDESCAKRASADNIRIEYMGICGSAIIHLSPLSCQGQSAKIRDTVQYNGFISYSHAADGNLAPAVQSALHRFARPWYRLRSVWIFRDKTGLAVTPSLWEAIQKALADSEYFLLMASPEAAASPWVQREVDWWLTNRSASNILILLTDGEIEWISGRSDFDWSRTTALPPNLRGRMAQEPLWVDLRWARTEEKLSLRNSRFRGAILDISSTLLNRPKESLDSEDVTIYKRNRMAAYAAVIVKRLTYDWRNH